MRDLKLPEERHPEKAHRPDNAQPKKPAWIRVKAPTSEGYKQTRDILRQFLVEAATLSTVGALIGIALGLLAAKIISMYTPLPAAIAPWSLVAATLLGTVVGIVSGVYPARRAARLDPIEALRQE